MKTLTTMVTLAAALWVQIPSGPGRGYGTISGTVVGLDGKPAADVRVNALEVRDGEGVADQASSSLARTDENGRFRLDEMAPGRYVIAAGLLDLPTYFPGVAARSAATVVTIAAAANLTGLDFRLAIAPELRFSGKVVRQDSAGQAVAKASAITQIRLSKLVGGAAQIVTAAVAANGSFEFTSVSPDTYRVHFAPFPAREPVMTVTLANANMTGYELAVPLMVPVNGAVTVEAGGAPPRFQLVFSNANDPKADPAKNLSILQTRVTAQVGAFFTTEVPAGANRVEINGLPSGFTVKSFAAGGVDLSSDPLKVTTAGVPLIEIVLGIANPAR